MKLKNTLFNQYILSLFCIINLEATAAIIIDHDGGVDDVIATTLQLLHNPNAIKAITITPADCYAHPAIWVTNQLKKEFLSTNLDIPVGVGDYEGLNQFPALWRNDAWELANLPLWHNPKSLHSFSLNHISAAHTLLIDVLRASTVPVKILMTGPCTNLADALDLNPELAQKIERVFIMGGALDVGGNVCEDQHDGTAEWNIYNHPEAFRKVLQSGVNITLIPLDATRYTPIRKEFIAKIAHHQHIKSLELLHQSLKVIQPLIDNGQYFFWDTLTSTAMINENIIKTKKAKIDVVLKGSSMGKIFEDENGFMIDVAIWADQSLFENTVFEVLSGI